MSNYKVVHFYITRMYNLTIQECTFLLYKSVHFYQSKLYTFVTADNQSVISVSYTH